MLFVVRVTDNVLPLCDEEYFGENDLVNRIVEFVRVVYGADTLEENLAFIAKALGNKGNTSREIIRNYFLKDFFADHCKIYQKRPIYWMFDSGKKNGFKALVYLHRWDADTTGRVYNNYLSPLLRTYAQQIVQENNVISSSNDARTVSTAQKRLDKLKLQQVGLPQPEGLGRLTAQIGFVRLRGQAQIVNLKHGKPPWKQR